MEVEVDISEESEKTQNLVDFLSKITVEKIGEHKFIVRFEGQLTKFKLQVGDIIGFLAWHWFMVNQKRKEQELEEKSKPKKETYTV